MTVAATMPDAPSAQAPIWGVIGKDGCKHFPVHAAQAEILQSKARFTAAIAGTGGGKTVIGALWTMLQVQRVIERPHFERVQGMVLAPTHQLLSRAAAAELVRAFYGTDLQGRYVPSKNRYELPRGLGTIWLLSSDEPEHIEAGQFDFIWADEAGQMSYEAWVAIQARTGQKQSPLLMTTTPYRLNWLKKEIMDRFRAGNPDYFVRTWESIANPAYPKAEYERARRELPAWLFRLRYEGLFTQPEGLVLSEFDADYNCRPCLYDPRRPILVGSDFNVDPMAWVLCHRRGDNGEVLEVFDEIFQRNTTTTRTLEFLHARYAQHVGGWEFYGDATGRGRHTSAAASDYELIRNDARFRKAGMTVHYSRANPACADRFAAMNAMFCNAAKERRLFIDPRCRRLLDDIENRYYRDGSREPADSGDVGHMTDALGYVVYRLFPIRTPMATRAYQVFMTGQ